MRKNLPLLAALAAALFAGCAADSRDTIDDLGQQADNKADSQTGSFVYLGAAPLTREAVEKAYALPGARSGVLYVIDLINQPELPPGEAYEAGIRFDQLPEIPDPEDVDLDAPPAPPTVAPPKILAFTSTGDAPLAPIPSACTSQPCPLDELDAPDAAYIGEGTEGQLWLVDIRPEDQLARLAFIYPDPIDPYTASVTTWCVDGCL